MSNQPTAWREFLLGTAIERCAVEVTAQNKSNLLSFSVLGVLMMSFALFFSWLMREIFTFNTEFWIMWAYFILMYVANKLMRKHLKHATTAFYLWMVPLMAMGIIIGTFGDPYEPSITIMVFLCVLPIFILDKPWRIVLFIVLNSAIYIVCCYLAKSPALFSADMIDLVLFSVLGIGVNCLVLRDRIHNVEYAMQMRLIAETDALTGLTNRGAGEEKVRLLMKQGIQGVLLLLDLDNFKEINDRYGHAAGDEALKLVALSLKQTFVEGDILIRFGGDEFMVFARETKKEVGIAERLDRMMQKVRSLSVSTMPDHRFSVSVGAVRFIPGHGKSFDTLYREADEALYASKRGGKNAYSFFSQLR